jgi:hypothetical protein
LTLAFLVNVARAPENGFHATLNMLNVASGAD